MFSKSQLEFLSNKKLALACSGGVDSMVLAHLLLKNAVKFDLIHCNFQLRGKDSEADEVFLEEFSQKQGLKLFKTKFDTKTLAAQNKNSIEMEARNLRYAYFEELQNSEKFDLILLGHHKDDHIETIFMRMLTGAGIQGLMGIQALHTNYYRPLMHCTKEEISDYATKNDVSFQQDITNLETDFLRNKLRNDILPKIQKINPAYRNSISQISDIAFQTKEMLDYHYGDLKSNFLAGRTVKLDLISTQPFFPIVLAYMLDTLEYNKSLIRDMSNSIQTKEAKYFQLGAHQIEIKDSCLTLVQGATILECTFTTLQELMQHDALGATLVDAVESYENDSMYLDAKKLLFPLSLRAYRQGDRMHPLGIIGYKKLSKIASELKYSINDKLQWKLLEDAQGEVVVLFGYRISEKVKLDSHSTHILKIKK